MAKSKRRPGGGRKPIGEVPKSAAFTTRLEPATRRALDDAAREKGDSVSNVAGYILKESLKKPSGKPHNLSLACAMALLAEKIERDAQKNWQEDQFTREALVYAIQTVLAYIHPEPKQSSPIPPAVEAAASKYLPPYAEELRTPKGFGFLLATHLIYEIEQATAQQSPSAVFNEWSLPIFFSGKPTQLALIGHHLGLATKSGNSK